MKIKLKTVLYWLSIVRPMADVIIGAVKGVVDAWKQINSDERLAKECEQMRIDHELPFLSAYIDPEVDPKDIDLSKATCVTLKELKNDR